MKTLTRLSVSIGLFITPLFFIPITREFYETNKTALLLILSSIAIWTILFAGLIQRGIVLKQRTIPFLSPLFILAACMTTYSALRLSNPYQDLVTGSFGPVTLLPMLVFAVLILLLTAQEKHKFAYPFILYSSIIEGCIVIVATFHPFSSASIPESFRFLQSSGFNTFGNPFDVFSLLLFSVILVVFSDNNRKNRTRAFITGLFLTGVLILLVARTPIRELYRSYAPLDTSTRLLSERLRTPEQFVFGSGVRSFEWSLPSAKNAAYNSSDSWQVATYLRAPSALLQLAVEGGLVGVLLFIGSLLHVLYANIIATKRSHLSIALLSLALILFIIFPVTWYTLFQTIIIVGLTIPEDERLIRSRFLFVLPTLFLALALTWSSWLFLRYYRAETATRAALQAVSEKNARELYQKQSEAVTYFPYGEQYRVDFSQTNVLLAQELASQNQTNQDYVTKAVQTAIQEAQSAVALNNHRASNWANLGSIYGQLLGVEGAQTWAVAAFQRAILLDPQNVVYRVQLGTIYYSLKEYSNAVALFEEAVALKPDHPNGLYNLAYSYYRVGSTEKSKQSFQRLLSILQDKGPEQYSRVLREKEELLGR